MKPVDRSIQTTTTKKKNTSHAIGKHQSKVGWDYMMTTLLIWEFLQNLHRIISKPTRKTATRERNYN